MNHRASAFYSQGRLMTGAKLPLRVQIHESENMRRSCAAQGSGGSANELRGTGLRSGRVHHRKPGDGPRPPQRNSVYQNPPCIWSRQSGTVHVAGGINGKHNMVINTRAGAAAPALAVSMFVRTTSRLCQITCGSGYESLSCRQPGRTRVPPRLPSDGNGWWR